MELFKYNDTPVRTIVKDDGPWFVLNDVCAILGITSPRSVTARLPEDYVGLTDATDSLGRTRQTTIVSEPGLNRVVLRSDKAEAEPFQRWVESRVLPSIRKTGSYSKTPELTGPELMAKALVEAQSTLEAKDAKIAELAPKADVFDQLLTAEGSYLVGDAAKILCNAGIQMGQKRLFQKLDELGWTSKPFGRPRRAMQRAVEQKLVVVKPVAYWDQKREERVIGDPQIRLTTKGIYKLRDVMLYPLELTA